MNEAFHAISGLLAHLLRGVGADVQRKGGGGASQISLHGLNVIPAFDCRHSFGQDNPTESDGVEVVRVVKYSQDWQRLGQASIQGVNIDKPFVFGSVRCTEYNGYLLIHTCREMYESFTNDGLNHQANISFIVKQSDMSWEPLGKCHVSRSFDQFILVDQPANIVRMDLGDGHPRAVTLSQYPKRLDKDSRPAAKPVTPEYSSKPQLTTDIPELRCAGCGYLMRAAGDKKNFDINLRGKTGGHFYLCLTCNAYAFCDACASKPGTEAVYLQHEGSCKGPA